jgi:hypothetical protein
MKTSKLKDACICTCTGELGSSADREEGRLAGCFLQEVGVGWIHVDCTSGQSEGRLRLLPRFLGERMCYKKIENKGMEECTCLSNRAEYE